MRNSYIMSITREWFTMSGAGEVEVTVTPPAVDNDKEKMREEIAELRGKLEAIENSTAGLSEEIRQWILKQLEPLKTTLDNLEATAKTGLENLAERMNELRSEMTDLSTRTSPDEPEVTVAEVIAPVQPLVEEDDIQTPALVQTAQPNEPVNQSQQKRQKRVV